MIDPLQSIAFDVGKVLLETRGRGAVQGVWEGTQFKAVADIEAHRLWCKRLRAEFPKMPIVSEEDPNSFSSARSQEYWLIDPLDGTASYAEGYSGFVTQAALIRQGQPIASVVFAPALNQCYMARRGLGATFNGFAMVNSCPDRLEVLIDNYPQPRDAARQVMVGLNMSRYVESGSIGLKLCRVAEGAADVFVKKVPVKPWDLAPANLILLEIGGCLSDANGRQVSYTDVATVNGLAAARSRASLERVVKLLEGDES